MDTPKLEVRNIGALDLKPFGSVDPMPTLERAVSALNRLDLNYFVSAGTALSLHRDKAFIPHDTDLDFAVHLPWNQSHHDTTIKIVRLFAQMNMPVNRFIVCENKPVQLVFRDLSRPDGVLIDVEFYYSGLIKRKMVHYKPEGYITIRPYKRAERAFKGLILPFPAPIEPYLKERYGKNWKIPNGKKGDWKDYTEIFTPWT